MENTVNTPIVQLTQKFDRQLLRILKNELKAVKKTKDQLIKKLNPSSDDGLLVA